ncbi:hypothetical protein BaRGS_00018614 [Batillaria attramentaria]|uniref:Uncharacterized protein n=1 Tax=Batillaria attramentaria TaxID=370345 RepID=A0ABD0KTJ2_9CAEN
MRPAQDKPAKGHSQSSKEQQLVSMANVRNVELESRHVGEATHRHEQIHLNMLSGPFRLPRPKVAFNSSEDGATVWTRCHMDSH